jgi:hypothetical protein
VKQLYAQTKATDGIDPRAEPNRHRKTPGSGTETMQSGKTIYRDVGFPFRNKQIIRRVRVIITLGVVMQNPQSSNATSLSANQRKNHGFVGCSRKSKTQLASLSRNSTASSSSSDADANRLAICASVL